MAGRPVTKPNITNTIAKTDSVKVEEKTNITTDVDIKKENYELKLKLENMMKMIENLQSSKIIETKIADKVTNIPDEIELIDMNKRVTITSITTGGVNLKTSTDGTAKSFRLDKLGQTIPIFYSDLLGCIATDRSMFEEGLIYINDKQIVKNEYLEDFYKKFLDINTITNIMDFDTETVKEMVSNTTDAIQETIIILIATKINKGESVDMNMVNTIEKSCKTVVDIRDIANKIR